MLVWNFKKSNNDAIKRAIELVNWNFLFSNKNVHEQVVIFNQTLMDIFSNYLPNILITADDKDPPWMNEYSKRKILSRKKFHVSLLILITKIMMPTRNYRL